MELIKECDRLLDNELTIPNIDSNENKYTEKFQADNNNGNNIKSRLYLKLYDYITNLSWIGFVDNINGVRQLKIFITCDMIAQNKFSLRKGLIALLDLVTDSNLILVDSVMILLDRNIEKMLSIRYIKDFQWIGFRPSLIDKKISESWVGMAMEV